MLVEPLPEITQGSSDCALLGPSGCRRLGLFAQMKAKSKVTQPQLVESGSESKPWIQSRPEPPLQRRY